MGQFAFILLGFPVKFIWSDCLKFVKLRIEDNQIEIVAQIYPCADEEGKVGSYYRRIKVVQGFGSLLLLVMTRAILACAYGKEEITDIVSDKYA